MKITESIYSAGVYDREIKLFEGQYQVPEGITYNSYVITDEKTAVIDTVDIGFSDEWLDRLSEVLKGRKPDYLIVQHMEPDHSASIKRFTEVYPEAVIVSNKKAFTMMENFFGTDFCDRRHYVENGDSLSLGKHNLSFVFAPMVHWPEVMVTYDSTERVLFSADAFGRFGAIDSKESWDDEARRYYIGIVGKYGVQVQNLLKKAAELPIEIICPLHGPVLTEDLSHYIGLYRTWSSYTVESDGIMIAYTSVYGNTKKAVQQLEKELYRRGCPHVVIYDLAVSDMAKAVADAFRYGKLVLATTTYNAGIFPYMREFISNLTERGFRSRTVALIENGSWAPQAVKVMKKMLEGCKDITWAENTVSIMSAPSAENLERLNSLAEELCRDYIALSSDTADKNNMSALNRIGYGLYVVTSHDGKRDNGLIVNTVAQVTDSPNRLSVTINKSNYSHHVIKQTGKMNVNCLSVDAPFEVFRNFGFQTGRAVDKFEGWEPVRSDNGLAILPRYINAVISLRVEQYVDLGTHGMFICSVTEARVMSDKETMTYSYYHENVKPKPETEGKKGYVCTICGYVYEGENLPDDFICPLCKHGAADFEAITE